MATETRVMGDQMVEQFKGRLAVMMLVHLALIVGVVIFGLVVLFLIHGKMSFAPAYQNPVVIVVGVLVAGNLLVASALNKFFFKVSGRPADAGAAVQKYQVFVLMRAALIEGGALFSAVVTLITCNILPACLLAICAGALVYFRPSQQEFVDMMRGAMPGGGVGRQLHLLVCLVVGSAVVAGADTFYLTNSATGQGFGPFQFRDGTALDIGGQTLTIQKVLTDEQNMLEFMKWRTITRLEFREANVSDVLDFLQHGGTDALDFPAICFAFPLSQLGISGTNKIAEQPKITFTGRNLSLYDVVNSLAAMLNLTWKVHGKVVVLQRKDAPPGGAPLPRAPKDNPDLGVMTDEASVVFVGRCRKVVWSGLGHFEFTIETMLKGQNYLRAEALTNTIFASCPPKSQFVPVSTNESPAQLPAFMESEVIVFLTADPDRPTGLGWNLLRDDPLFAIQRSTPVAISAIKRHVEGQQD